MIGNVYLLIVVAMGGTFFMVFLMIFLQVRTQNKVLSQKKISAEREIAHQKELARTLIVSQESERKRIGMDLHDEVGTVLSTLRMHLEMMAEADPAQLVLLNVTGKKSIDNIINSVRRISHNLSPFIKGAYELKDGVENLTEQLATANKITVEVAFNGIEKFDFLGDDTQLALYRIISELINNTIKHAAANAVQITFAKTHMQLLVTYEDNGSGVATTDDRKKGIGMSNIESRCNAMGATRIIDENREKGFGMTITIPITV